jgi:hypothetical protein
VPHAQSLLSLNDAELDVVMELAAPLQRHQRSAFLHAVAAELSAHPATAGPGTVHRIAVRLQREYLRATHSG